MPYADAGYRWLVFPTLLAIWPVCDLVPPAFFFALSLCLSAVLMALADGLSDDVADRNLLLL
jgi:hypothetical protein